MLKYVSALAICLAAGAPAAAQPFNLTLAGFSPGGLASSIGIGMDAALSSAYPGSAITYQTSSGGLANAMLVSQGKVPLGLIGDTEIPIAWLGKPPFKMELKNLRLLFQPIAGESRFLVSHVVVAKAWVDANKARTFADLKGKTARIAINRPGNNDGEVSLAMLRAVGVTPETIAESGGQLVRAASAEMKSLMLDRRVDMFILGVAYNHPSIHEIASSLDIVMLPVSDEVASGAAAEWGASKCVIRSSEYKYLKADTSNPCVGIGVYVSDAMSEQIAYKITKAMYEHIGKLKGAHRLLAAAVTKESLAQGGGVPFHPGAAKYLREAGLMK